MVRRLLALLRRLLGRPRQIGITSDRDRKAYDEVLDAEAGAGGAYFDVGYDEERPRH